MVYNTKIGEVTIDKANIDNSVAHKYSQPKLDAIPTLPKGFGNAVYLGSLDDFANRNNTTSHYFAYPINYKGELAYVFCRANEDANTNRLYVHEVFFDETIKANTLQTAAGALKNGKPHGGISLYKNILADEEI